MSKQDKQTEEVTVEDVSIAVTEEAGEEEQIGRVREILFGTKSRQLEDSLSRLEAAMRAEQASLRKEFRERFESLEAYLKSEVKALLEKLDREETERSQAVKNLADKLGETGEELAHRAGAIHKRIDESERELRELILQARQRLTDDIKDRTDELTDRLQSESKNLRKGKADRSTMAALLTDMASRLSEVEEED